MTAMVIDIDKSISRFIPLAIGILGIVIISVIVMCFGLLNKDHNSELTTDNTNDYSSSDLTACLDTGELETVDGPEKEIEETSPEETSLTIVPTGVTSNDFPEETKQSDTTFEVSLIVD